MPIKNAFDFFIQLHITERCNLRCKHCYQTGKTVDEMAFQEIAKTIKEISDTLNEWKEAYNIEYAPSFNVTGGEPFLREDLFDIIAEIISRGFDVYLLTNGILIDRKKARGFFNLGVKGVQVSMKGPEAVHNAIRGNGSFAGSLKGVKNILDAGLKVTLNTTLSRVNASSFMDMIALSSELGVHSLGFSRLVPSGKGESMLKQMLSSREVRDLYSRIFSEDTGNLEIVTGDPVAAQINTDGDTDAGNTLAGGCAAGLSGLTILPDGTLVPCRRLHIPMGNIRKDSFREVWAASEVLEAIRDRSRYKGKCGNCPRWAACRGCRAIAFAFSKAHGSNDFLAEDPQCFIR
jgi:radical SAM protein with 4Fe4S-binding SPASM domain